MLNFGVFRLLSASGDDRDRRTSPHISRESSELFWYFRSLQSRRLRQDCLALKSSPNRAPAETDGECFGGDGISRATSDSCLSSSSITLTTCCLTKAATVVIKLGSLTVFPTKACVKVSDQDQQLKLRLIVSSSARRWTISMITFSTTKEEDCLRPAMTAQ